jgi:hypothetical protein
MGGGGGLLGGVTDVLFGAPQTVATPDYAGAATATAQGNLDAARAAAASNRVNQVTPYGNLSYKITGQDPYGNPTWTATQSLAPAQQQLLDLQNQASIGMGQLSNQGLQYVQNMMSKPFDTSQLASTGINPGENYSDAIMRQLQPQIQQDRESLGAQLANQGIMPGSQAYENAMRVQGSKEAQMRDQAIVGGMQTGLAANQQGFNQLAYQRNEPINTLNAVRTGAQVTNPSYVNAPQQATTSGADLMSATQAGYNANLGAANAQNARSNAMMQGLFSMGGAYLGS